MDPSNQWWYSTGCSRNKASAISPRWHHKDTQSGGYFRSFTGAAGNYANFIRPIYSDSLSIVISNS